MIVTQKHIQSGVDVFWRTEGDACAVVKAVLEDFMSQFSQPGELVVGEPVAPQRDYRKELWIDVASAVAGDSGNRHAHMPAHWADEALKAFDKTFGEKQ